MGKGSMKYTLLSIPIIFLILMIAITNCEEPFIDVTYTYSGNVEGLDVEVYTSEVSEDNENGIADDEAWVIIEVDNQTNTSYRMRVQDDNSGTASSAGIDYDFTPVNYMVQKNKVSDKTITLTLTEDTINEYNETVVLNISIETVGGGSIIVFEEQATITIVDNDSIEISFLTDSSPNTEMDENILLPVELTASSTLTTTVDYTISGTAVNGVDFVLADGSLTFDPLITTGSIPLIIYDDLYDEEDETIVITLSNPSTNAVVGQFAIYTRTILDNDDISNILNLSNQAGYSDYPAIAFNGTVYGIVWQDVGFTGNYEIFFTTIEEKYVSIDNSTIIQITNNGTVPTYMPKITAKGNNFGIAWQDRRDGNSEIYFCEVDATGTKIISDIRVTNNSGYSAAADIVWDGSNYGIAWNDNSDGDFDIYFTLLDASGNKIITDHNISNTTVNSSIPDIDFNGTNYGIVWWDSRLSPDYQVYFALINSSGSLIGGSDIAVSSIEYFAAPRIIWNGNDFGIVWSDDRDGNSEVYFNRINSSGIIVGSDIRLTNNTGASVYPNIDSNYPSDSQYFISWQDESDGFDDVFYLILNSDGSIYQSELKVTTDNNQGGMSGYGPTTAVSYNGTDSFGIIWDGNSDTDIFLTRVE